MDAVATGAIRERPVDRLLEDVGERIERRADIADLDDEQRGGCLVPQHDRLRHIEPVAVADDVRQHLLDRDEDVVTDLLPITEPVEGHPLESSLTDMPRDVQLID